MTATATSLWPDKFRDSIVSKALIAYASVSWLLLQIISTLIQGLGLPDWVFTGFLIILLAGLPVLVIAARASSRKKNPVSATPPGFTFGRINFRRAALGGGLMLSLWVAIVGAFMASWAFGVGPAASLLAAGTLKRSDSVLIAEFSNRTRDPMLAKSVTEAIRLDLSQSNLIRVADSGDVGDALERMNIKQGTPLEPVILRELAVREGMAGVLEGEVAALGPATLISVRLVDPRNGKTMAEFQERAKDEGELLDAVDRLSSTLRNKIGEPLTTLRVEPPLAKVTTASMPALRAYTEANAAHAAGKKEEAIALLRTALTLDSSFPMAWRKLGALLGDDYPAEARAAYANAYTLRDRLPERERELATASYFKNVETDLPQAMAAYRRVLSSYPDDEVALNNLANLHTAFRQPQEALKLQQRIIQSRPRFAAYSNLFNAYVRLGQLDNARQAHQSAIRLFPDQKRVKFQPIILALAASDYAEADRLMNSFLAVNRDKPDLINDLFVARYELKRGRLDRARQIFRERARIANSKEKSANAIEAMTSVIAISAVMGQATEGRALLSEILATYPLAKIPDGQRPYLDLAMAFASVGDAANGRRYLQLSEGQGDEDNTLNYDQPRRAQGLIAFADGRFDEAVTILADASRFGQCSTCLLLDLGLAQEAAGRPADAMATYQRYLRLAPSALARGEMLGFVLARLADLQTRAGDRQAALATRQRLRALWAGADGPLLARLESADRGPLPS